jgi:malate dehydrogenase
MLRLDHNRAVSQLATRTGKAVTEIEKMIVWGNHSPTMYPDIRFCTVAGQAAPQAVNDEAWYRNEYIPKVGKRGAAIIEARGASSAASAANAAIDHMRDWALGTNGKWVTMGIPSDGSYGIRVRRPRSLRKNIQGVNLFAIVRHGSALRRNHRAFRHCVARGKLCSAPLWA